MIDENKRYKQLKLDCFSFSSKNTFNHTFNKRNTDNNVDNEITQNDQDNLVKQDLSNETDLESEYNTDIVKLNYMVDKGILLLENKVNSKDYNLISNSVSKLLKIKYEIINYKSKNDENNDLEDLFL
ncbi:hypothetical protein J2127_001134 [Methanococcus voltae]|uniref:hypothetical protein n=1 Tax=Methanococcus voltae TaxID=2188 RepID=UPI001AE3F586|nr:hypothetical protein [Methanococcus voltae]MBP2143965.1 hypothetical protein [Methanococcus voltae]